MKFRKLLAGLLAVTMFVTSAPVGLVSHAEEVVSSDTAGADETEGAVGTDAVADTDVVKANTAEVTGDKSVTDILSAASGVNLLEQNSSKAKELVTNVFDSFYYKVSGDTEAKNFVRDEAAYTYKFADGVNPRTVSEVAMKYNFALADSDNRTIKEGDYICISLPECFQVSDTSIKQLVFDEGSESVTLANYQFVEVKASGTKGQKDYCPAHYDLYIVFTDTVNADKGYEELVGEVAISCQVNEEAKSSQEEKTYAIKLGDTTAFQMLIPAASSVLAGISKEGTFNKEDYSIDWTITVGTDDASAGLPLEGITLTDSLLDNYETYVSGADQNGNPISWAGPVTESNRENATGNNKSSYTYTFPTGVTAPATVTMHTKMSDAGVAELNELRKTDANAELTISNEVAMSAPENSAITVDADKCSSSASVAASTAGISKMGDQVDAETMRWTIDLNSQNVNVYKATVTDPLSEELSLNENTYKDDAGERHGVKITNANGELITYAKRVTGTEEISKDESAGEDRVYYWTESADKKSDQDNKATSNGNQVVHVKFDHSFSTEYKIVFETHIDTSEVADTEDDSKKKIISNNAGVVAEFPEGTGLEPSEYGIPDVNMEYHSAYIKETAVNADSTTGELTWRLEPSTIVTEWSTVSVSTSIDSDHKFMKGNYKVLIKEGTKLADGSIVSANKDGRTLELNTDFTRAYGSTKDSDHSADQLDGADQLTWIFTKKQLDYKGIMLDDIEIIYTTKATSYFGNNDSNVYGDGNGENGTVDEKSKVVVTKKVTLGSDQVYSCTARARQALNNDLINKSVKVEYDDVNNKAYFHYMIRVNNNGNTLSNVSVLDDLSNAFFANAVDTSTPVMDENTQISAELFTLTETAGDEDVTSGKLEDHVFKSYVADETGSYNKSLTNKLKINNSSKLVELSGGESNPLELKNAATIHLYVSLSESGIAELNKENGSLWNKAIATRNTATLKADELTADQKMLAATCESTDVSSEIVNKFMTKSGKKSEAYAIDWTLEVNPAFATFGTTNVIDTIPANLYLDKDSIAIYQANHSSEDGSNLIEDTDQLEVDFKVNASKEKDGTTKLTIAFPESGNDSYLVKYTTDVLTKKGGTFTNTADVTSNANTMSQTSKVVLENASSAGGYRKAIFKFTKLDDLSEAGNHVPVEGAKYGLYSDETCSVNSLVDEAYSDSKGSVQLVGKTGTKYWIQEISVNGAKAADGTGSYILDDTVYGSYTGERGINNIKAKYVKNDKEVETKYFYNTRNTSALGAANITKEFNVSGLDRSEKGLQATYNLYVCPNAKKNDDGTYAAGSFKKQVFVSGEAGVYQFAGYKEEADITKSLLTSKAGDREDGSDFVSASLLIKNLPHGVYVLKETKSADGFVTDTTEKTFVVSENGSDQADVSYLNGFENGEASLINNPTELNVNVDHEHSVFEIKGQFVNEDGSLTDEDSTRKLQWNKVTDENGNTTFKESLRGILVEGNKYSLTETKIPNGYQQIGGQEITVGKEPININLTHQANNFKFHVEDQNGVVITGAKVIISPDKGSKFASSAKETIELESGEGNNEVSNELIAGNTYVITEQVPNTVEYRSTGDTAYKIKISNDGKTATLVNPDNEDNEEISIDPNGTLITLTNHRYLANASVTVYDSAIYESIDKADNQDAVITRGAESATTSGATFDLYRIEKNADGSDLEIKIAGLTDSDQDGVISTDQDQDVTNTLYGNQPLSKGLPVGDYLLREITPPTGYQLPSTVDFIFSVTDRDDGKVIVKEAVNDRIPGTVTVVKTDRDSKNPVNGAVYGIYTAVASTSGTGADLEAVKVDGQKLTVTTDEDGKAVFSNLPWGTNYIVKEIAPASGYTLDTEYHQMANGGSFGRTYLSETINVTDEKTNVSVEIKDQDNAKVKDATITVASAESSNFANKPDKIGNTALTWSEDGRSFAYTSTESVMDFSGVFVAGKTYTMTEKHPDIVLPTEKKATDNKTSQILEFELSSDGKTVNVKASGDGDYKNEYKNYLNLTVDVNNKLVLHNQTTPVAQLKVELKDAVSNENITTTTGVKFELYKVIGENRTLVTELVTDNDGCIKTKNQSDSVKNADRSNIEISKGLTKGHYVLVQQDSPVGYEKSAEVSFDVSNSKDVNVSILNNRLPGTIYIHKNALGVEGDAKSVQGAAYGLYTKNDDNYVKAKDKNGLPYSVSLNSKGDASFTDLAWNQIYYVKEESAPEGYTLDQDYHEVSAEKQGSNDKSQGTFTWSSDKTVNVTVGDQATSLTFKRQAYDAHGTLQTGIVSTYTITGRFAGETESTTRVFTTDQGEYNFNNLLITGETYQVHEVTDSQKTEGAFKNVTTADLTYNSVADYEFHLSETGDILPGDAANTHEVSVSNKKESAHEIIMTSYATRIYLLQYAEDKLNSDDPYLAGGSYVVYGTKGGEINLADVKKSFGNEAEGDTLITGLVPGTYVLRQTGAPASYDVDSDITFTVKHDGTLATKSDETRVTEGKPYAVAMDNSKGDYAVITLTDPTNYWTFKTTVKPYNDDVTAQTELSDVTFEIFTDSQCKNHATGKSSVSSNENGIVDLQGLEAGTYYLKETNVPSNVIMDSNVYVAKMKGNELQGLYQSGTDEKVKNQTIVHEVNRGTIEFTKVNNGNIEQPVAGAEYKLYQLNAVRARAVDSNVNTAIATAVSDQNGKVTFTNIVEGQDYRIVETANPNGYLLSEDSVSVSWEKDQSVWSLSGQMMDESDGNFLWKETQSSVNVTSVDESEAELSGMTLKLTDITNNTTETSAEMTWTDGVKNITGHLITGHTYSLTETSPASGYQQILDEITFKINSVSGNIEEVKKNREHLTENDSVFRIEADTNTIVVKHEPTKFVFKIKDQNGELVSGAQVTLTSTNRSVLADGSDSYSWTSIITGEGAKASNAETIIKKLIAGNTYQLVENVPDGYVSASINPSVMIQVSEDGHTASVSNRGVDFVNDATPYLYLTGQDASKDLQTGFILMNHRILKKSDDHNHIRLILKDGTDRETCLEGGTFALYQQTGEQPSEQDILVADGTSTSGLTSDEKGMIDLKNIEGSNPLYPGHGFGDGLPTGKYYFKQVGQAPTGYVYRQEDGVYKFAVTEESGSVDLTAYNERIPGTISLKKLISEYGTSLDGIEYKLYSGKTDKTGKIAYTEEAITGTEAVAEVIDEQGNVTFTFTGLSWDKTYYIRETKAPKGYTLDKTIFGGYGFNATKTEHRVVLSNGVTSLTLHKSGYDHDGKYVADLVKAKFKVTGTFANGSTEMTGTTGDNGDFAINNQLIMGNTYEVEESEAPKGYLKAKKFEISVAAPDAVGMTEAINAEVSSTVEGNETEVKNSDGGAVTLSYGYDPQEVEVTSSSSVSNTITVTDYQTYIFIHQNDEDDKTLSGGSYAIYGTDKNGEKEEDDVKAEFSTKDYSKQATEEQADRDIDLTKADHMVGLKPGTYVLTQTESPVGYMKDEDITFTLERDNIVKIIKEVDGQKTEEAVSTKYESGHQAAGAPNGSYAQLVMKDQPTLLRFTTEVKPYNGNEDKTYGKLYDTSKISNVTYNVYEENPLAAVGELKPVETLTSDDDGQISVTKLKVGTYYIRAKSTTNRNVKLDTSVYKILVDGTEAHDLTTLDDQKLDEGAIVNEVKRGTFTFTKVDKDNTSQLLSGSVYGLYQAVDVTEEDLVDPKNAIQAAVEVVTDSVENLVDKVLSFGALKANAAEADDSAEVEVAYPEAITVDGKDYKLVATATTDAEGKLTFENVVAGQTYYVKELAAPEGYQVSETPMKVKMIAQNRKDEDGNEILDEDGKTIEEIVPEVDMDNATIERQDDGTIIWKEPQLKVTINKVDPDGRLLAGATLQLTDLTTGEVVAAADGRTTWVSSSDYGQVFNGILIGGHKYRIDELSAPQGYEKATMEFVAEKRILTDAEAEDENVAIQSVILVDYHTASLPITSADKVENSDGSIGTTGDTTLPITRGSSPKTGDVWESIILLAIIALGAAAVLLYLTVMGRRRYRHNDIDQEEE